MSDDKESVCPICGKEVESGAEYCENCGSPLDALEMDLDDTHLEDSLASLEEIVTEEPETVSVCPKCGDFTRPTDVSCQSCGFQLKVPEEREDPGPPSGKPIAADAMYLCPECGAFLSEEAKVCDICGATLSVEKKIGAGEFAGTKEQDRTVCMNCGAYLDESTGECPICSDETEEPVADLPVEEVDIEEDIDTFLEELESTETEEEPLEGLVETMDTEIEEEPPVPVQPSVGTITVERPVEPTKQVELPKTSELVPRKLPRSRLLQRRRTQVQRVQEFIAYSSLVAIATYYVASQTGLSLVHWIMVGFFGVAFGISLALAAINLPMNWKSATKVALPFLIGVAILISMPTLYLAGNTSLSSFEVPLVAVGVLLALVGIIAMSRDYLVNLIWLVGSLLILLMALSALELAGPVGLSDNVTVAFWIVGFIMIVLSVALIIRTKWIRILIDTEILAGDKKYRERRYKDSIAAYDKAISASASLKDSSDSSSNMDVPWYSKGAALTILGKYEEAIECIDNALKLSPTNEVALVNKGIALSRLGRHREALKCYNEALRVNPSYEVAWNNKGNALTRLRRYEEAIKSYDRAIQLDDEYREAWVNKGYVLAKMGDYDGAAKCADFVSRFSTPGASRVGEKLIS